METANYVTNATPSKKFASELVAQHIEAGLIHEMYFLDALEVFELMVIAEKWEELTVAGIENDVFMRLAVRVEEVPSYVVEAIKADYEG